MNYAGLRISRRVVGIALVLAISACTSQRPRPETAAVESAPEIVPTTRPEHLDQQRLPEQSAEIAAHSAWDRLRTRFAMSGCAYSDTVLHEAHRYTRSAQRFSASWQAAMPSLLLVLEEIERRDLPGEFALLPYVESGYRTLPAKAKGPAGIWQLMSRTAIDRGLQISRDYDQRLDIQASTTVALDLIERYDREFSDWRLASMAFNAGEYRVKRALGDIHATSLDAKRLARLKLATTTHQHLIRLLALSCIVLEPERFGIQLPPQAEDDRLVRVIPPTAIDLRLAAALADLDLDDVIRFNAAWSGQSRPHGPATHLLLPARSADRLNLALKDFPADMLGAWHTQRIDVATALADLASLPGVTPHVLAVVNRLDQDSRLQGGQSVLLPGAEPASDLPPDRQIHAIKPGDTLSAIALRYRIRLQDLLRWNGLNAHSILRPGSTLHLQEPSNRATGE